VTFTTPSRRIERPATALPFVTTSSARLASNTTPVRRTPTSDWQLLAGDQGKKNFDDAAVPSVDRFSSTPCEPARGRDARLLQEPRQGNDGTDRPALTCPVSGPTLGGGCAPALPGPAPKGEVIRLEGGFKNGRLERRNRTRCSSLPALFKKEELGE
jgi:hypothetical protein